MNRAIYPGSFDPVTNGHLDIILRTSNLYDELIVAVLNNSLKRSLFSVDERMSHLEMLTKGIKNVKIDTFEGLLVHYAQQKHANIIIRGLRAVTDFEYEFTMSLTNRKMSPNLETLFISSSAEYMYLSSSVVKEIASFGGNIDDMVPQGIIQFIFEKYR